MVKLLYKHKQKVNNNKLLGKQILHKTNHDTIFKILDIKQNTSNATETHTENSWQ